MANNTYVALDKKTTLSDVSSVEFTSIPQGYTDLVIVANVRYTATNIGQGLGIRFNNDSSANYTATVFEGDGSTASSYRQTGGTQGIISAPANGSQTGFSPFVVSVMNYSNATTMKPWISRNSGPTYVNGYVGLWRATPQAITSMQFIPSASAGNIATGSTFSLYGILAEAISPVTKAIGGAVYSDSTYYYHVFGASGTFTPLQTLTCDYIVVAGGGGGGGTTGGGGGAGGFYSTTSASLSATNYTVTVGAGGAAGTNNGSSGSAGGKGSNSSFNSITRTGGGGGGTSPNIPTYAATTGGSGGGGARSGSSQPGAAGNQGGYSPVEGYAGGNNYTGGSVYGTGGGGGAGGAGQAGTSTFDGAGGIGATSSLITAIVTATGAGELVSGTGYIAGGGGGASGDVNSLTRNGALGGYGGGGKGGSDNTYAVAGKTSTGSGGGGSGYVGGYLSGTNGGSGVVVIRYAK